MALAWGAQEGLKSRTLLAVQKTFLDHRAIAVAGIEFARLDDGRLLTYDINTNTNYNPTAEQAAGVTPGPARLAAHLMELLAADSTAAAAA
jgi:hypothetical protein